MTTFNRSGHWRTAPSGQTHWVSEHNVDRDAWDGYPGHHTPARRLADPTFSDAPFSSFTIPNASCPVCGASVFFYQSPHKGRVFFDELGPPWPKHPCTDNPELNVYRPREPKPVAVLRAEREPTARYQWILTRDLWLKPGAKVSTVSGVVEAEEQRLEVVVNTSDLRRALPFGYVKWDRNRQHMGVLSLLDRDAGTPFDIRCVSRAHYDANRASKGKLPLAPDHRLRQLSEAMRSELLRCMVQMEGFAPVERGTRAENTPAIGWAKEQILIVDVDIWDDDGTTDHYYEARVTKRIGAALRVTIGAPDMSIDEQIISQHFSKWNRISPPVVVLGRMQAFTDYDIDWDNGMNRPWGYEEGPFSLRVIDMTGWQNRVDHDRHTELLDGRLERFMRIPKGEWGDQMNRRINLSVAEVQGVSEPFRRINEGLSQAGWRIDYRWKPDRLLDMYPGDPSLPVERINVWIAYSSPTLGIMVSVSWRHDASIAERYAPIPGEPGPPMTGAHATRYLRSEVDVGHFIDWLRRLEREAKQVD